MDLLWVTIPCHQAGKSWLAAVSWPRISHTRQGWRDLSHRVVTARINALGVAFCLDPKGKAGPKSEPSAVLKQAGRMMPAPW